MQANDTRVAGAVFLAALLAQLPTFDRSIVPMDEGHLAAVAMGIGDGLALYRDLHTGVFPAIYHLTAVLFGIFGDDLLVARVAQMFTNAGVCLCLWLAGRRVMSPAFAVLVVLSFPVLAMFNYSSLALLVAMLSLVLTMKLLEDGRRSSAVALGVTLAFGVFCKQNFGALAFVASAIAIFGRRRGSALENQSWSSFLVPIALSGAMLTFGFVLYFVVTGTFDDFLFSTVIQLGGDQLESFNNPIPPIFGHHPLDDGRFVFLYSPPFLFNAMLRGETVFGLTANAELASAAMRMAYGLTLLTLVVGPLLWWFGVGRVQSASDSDARMVVVFAALFFLGIFPSAIFSHLVFVLAPVLLAFVFCISRFEHALGERRRPLALGLRITTGAVAVCAIAFIATGSAAIARWFPEPLDLEHASLKVDAGQAHLLRDTVAFLEGCGDEGEAIFVAPTMPVVYFLAQRPNVHKFDLTIPGHVDGPAIAQALRERNTRCIVYNPVMYPEFPAFAQMFPTLDRHLRSHYRTQRRLGQTGETWLGLVPRTRPP